MALFQPVYTKLRTLLKLLVEFVPHSLRHTYYARVAKLADAKDLKSFFRKRKCGFDSRPGHQKSNHFHKQTPGFARPNFGGLSVHLQRCSPTTTRRPRFQSHLGSSCHPQPSIGRRQQFLDIQAPAVGQRSRNRARNRASAVAGAPVPTHGPVAVPPSRSLARNSRRLTDSSHSSRHDRVFPADPRREHRSDGG